MHSLGYPKVRAGLHYHLGFVFDSDTLRIRIFSTKKAGCFHQSSYESTSECVRENRVRL